MNEQNKILISLLMQLESLLHRQMTTKRQGKRMNPHRGQGRVLSVLKLKPQITQKELTYILDMSKQALGELLNKLENCGYITRMPSQEDKRILVITLTEKGKKAADKMEHENEKEEDIFQCLTEEEQKNLSHYLERLIHAWQMNDRMYQEHSRWYRNSQRSHSSRMEFGFGYFPESENFRR